MRNKISMKLHLDRNNDSKKYSSANNSSKVGNNQIIFSYIMNTKYYDQLRLRLSGILSTQQLKQLVSGIDSTLKYQCQKIVHTFYECTVLIVVYGELQFQDKVYKRGQFIKIDVNYLSLANKNAVQQENSNHHHQMFRRYTQLKFQVQNESKDSTQQLRPSGRRCTFNFTKPSTLILINSQIIEHRIVQLREARYKIQLLSKCLPISQLKITESELKQISKLLQLFNIHQKYSYIPGQPGIYILYNGLFQLCSQTQNIPVMELQNNFVQIMSNEYRIRLKDRQGAYGFINRLDFYQILGQQSRLLMQNSWKSKQKLVHIIRNKTQYLFRSKELRQKIKIKQKRQKKQKNANLSLSKSSLMFSRQTMLSKCSLNAGSEPIQKSRRLVRPKTSQSKDHIFKHDEAKASRRKLVSEAELNISNLQQRLKKMKLYNSRRQHIKFQDEWYNFDVSKMHKSIQMSYYQIKTTEKNPQEADKMCNYKRVHRIYSDPCFRKPKSFRNF